MHWFEYDKAEEQLEALGSQLVEAMDDLHKYKLSLSLISLRAIENEITRLNMYMEDIQELIDEKSPVINE